MHADAADPQRPEPHPPAVAAGLHRRGGVMYLNRRGDASPLLNWLAAFTRGGTLKEAEGGLEDGSLEPLLDAEFLRGTLDGFGIAPSDPDERAVPHVDVILTTPNPHVMVGVSLGGPVKDRLLLGLKAPEPGEPKTVVGHGDVVAAVRSAMAGLRAGVADVPHLPGAVPSRPFRAPEGGRSFAQLAARAGLALDPAAAEAVDRLQESANVQIARNREALREGTLTPEESWEKAQVGTRAWLVEAHRLVGAEALTAVLGASARPSDPPPDMPGWPYWLRAAVARGRDKGERRDTVEMMRAMQYLAANRGEDAIDAAYARLDVSTLSELTMMTLLRSVFMARGRLAGWAGFRDRVRGELGRRGLDADVLLIGLGGPGEDMPDQEDEEG